MIATVLDFVSEVRSHFPLVWDIATAFAALIAIFVIVFLLELRSGGDLRRYRTRNFLTDSLYALFYQAGIHNRFVQVPVLAAVADADRLAGAAGGATLEGVADTSADRALSLASGARFPLTAVTS